MPAPHSTPSIHSIYKYVKIICASPYLPLILSAHVYTHTHVCGHAFKTKYVERVGEEKEVHISAYVTVRVRHGCQFKGNQIAGFCDWEHVRR